MNTEGSEPAWWGRHARDRVRPPREDHRSDSEPRGTPVGRNDTSRSVYAKAGKKAGSPGARGGSGLETPTPRNPNVGGGLLVSAVPCLIAASRPADSANFSQRNPTLTNVMREHPRGVFTTNSAKNSHSPRFTAVQSQQRPSHHKRGTITTPGARPARLSPVQGASPLRGVGLSEGPASSSCPARLSQSPRRAHAPPPARTRTACRSPRPVARRWHTVPPCLRNVVVTLA